jgi:hypothetical protein
MEHPVEALIPTGNRQGATGIQVGTGEGGRSIRWRSPEKGDLLRAKALDGERNGNFFACVPRRSQKGYWFLQAYADGERVFTES